MEEDNALDIYRSFGNGEAELEEDAYVRVGERVFHAKVRLRGNLLCCQSLTDEGEAVAAVEPLIFVLIKCQVSRVEECAAAASLNGHSHPAEFAFGFLLTFKEERLLVFLRAEERREKWMVKIATCSHEMAQAELDEITYKLFSMNTPSPSTSSQGVPSASSSSPNSFPSSLLNFFLTNPFRTDQNFAVSQRSGPARQLLYEETLWESKLSIALPLEFVKLYRQWNSELLLQLHSFEGRCPPDDVAALHELMRLSRDNKETLEQTWEFLSTYTGPSFRKSVEKRRVAFAPVPTNLHVQYFGPAGEGRRPRHLITAGVAAALPLRFQSGGLTRLRASLPLHPAYTDVLFSAKRQELLEVRKMIGSLSHELEKEWPAEPVRAPGDSVCVGLLGGVKQVFARLRDVESGLAGGVRQVDALVDLGHAPDSLKNQMDTLDAALVSLQSKLAALQTLSDDTEEHLAYCKSAREAMAFALDVLLTLCECLLDAQQLGRLRSLARSADSTIYTHILMRADFVFSQATTIAATAVLTRLSESWPMLSNDKPADLLLVVWSWLSCYGDERGMLEDACEAWRSVSSRLLIRLLRAPSSVARNVTPLAAGHRHCVIVSLPLPQEAFDALPEAVKNAEYIRVTTAFWTLGVNHEATIGQQFGATAFESNVNQCALSTMLEYAATRATLPTTATEALAGLENAVRSEPSRKNMTLYEWTLAAAAELDAEAVVSCKSGKDRTAMGVTLEQGRLMRQESGLNQQQASEVVDSLRRLGARREVCRKNIDKAAYSFSAFQMHFLPRSFRPPPGTFAHGLST